MTLLWQWTQPTIYTHDSQSYLAAARAMIGQAGGHFLYFRTEGYPLLLALTGVPILGTFRGLLTLQALMSAAVPPLVYLMLRPVDRRAALGASVLVLIAGIPLVFSKTVMTETSYVFFATVALLAATRAMAPAGNRALCGMLAAAFMLALLRPSARLLAVLLCTYVAVARYRIVPAWRQALLPPAAAVAVVLGLGAVAGLYHRSLAEEIMPGWHGLRAPRPGGQSAMTGKTLFLGLYLAGSHYVPSGAVAAENGPATRRLLRELEDFSAAHPGRLQAFATEASPLRPGSPTLPSRLAVAEPNLRRQFDWWTAMDATFGVEEADRLFLEAAIEALRRHPQLALLPLRNAVVALFGPSQSSAEGRIELQVEPLSLEQFREDPGLGDRLAGEIRDRGASPRDATIADAWGGWFFVLKSVLAVLAILALPWSLRGRGRHATALCTLAWLYEVGILSLFAEPRVRYVALAFVPLSIGATLGVLAVWDRWHGSSAPVPSRPHGFATRKAASA